MPVLALSLEVWRRVSLLRLPWGWWAEEVALVSKLAAQSLRFLVYFGLASAPLLLGFLPLALFVLQELARFARFFFGLLLADNFGFAFLLARFGFYLCFESFGLLVDLPLASGIESLCGFAAGLERRQRGSLGVVARGQVVQAVGMRGVL